jgi:DNA-binding NarL/FixJ family response regulator
MKRNFEFTKRQWQIYNLLIKGNNYADIAKIINVTHQTAKNTALNMYKRCGASTASQMVHIVETTGGVSSWYEE